MTFHALPNQKSTDNPVKDVITVIEKTVVETEKGVGKALQTIAPTIKKEGEALPLEKKEPRFQNFKSKKETETAPPQPEEKNETEKESME